MKSFTLNNKHIHLIECPRDAMQGWKTFIPTEKKIEYLQSLLQVGFHTLDFGSFVSAKAIPQLADTAEVLKGLKSHPVDTTTQLLAIIANVRGAEDAAAYEEISYLGFPFSVSETFQQRNTNSSIRESLERVKEIQRICEQSNKQLVIYISMGFGNPYGDPYSPAIVFDWVNRIAALGVQIISLADTVGLATPEQVTDLTSYVINKLPQHEIGVHLHSSLHNRQAKIEAAWQAGCRRFDGALKGIGGCPMANDDLVGNIDTEWLISYLEQYEKMPGLNKSALAKSLTLANEIFTL
ncbi:MULTISPECIES: hydroxymethylglutaryl-CoA lyase [Niastella]|uniref:Hydroxymethylglutaryl-CoA lyase n=1 Tax=Niastella soli TaxID=2821487 RepID=A0ABS3YWR4_9BACT|nr:hydroxymethylglutaryl-CoA lyase [Niastella soli]MBO9202308.1 hydroxymethylglutaryl-CoA lyase [Niastella soli]